MGVWVGSAKPEGNGMADFSGTIGNRREYVAGFGEFCVLSFSHSYVVSGGIGYQSKVTGVDGVMLT